MNDTTELARKDETAVAQREDEQSRRGITLTPPVDTRSRPRGRD